MGQGSEDDVTGRERFRVEMPDLLIARHGVAARMNALEHVRRLRGKGTTCEEVADDWQAVADALYERGYR